MTHQELENLTSDYLEGLLEASQRIEVEAHLSGCAECRELVDDVRRGLALCRTAELAEPKPWLISKIMLATVGERKLTWRERIAEYFRPVRSPRVAYSLAMSVFTFSIIINAAGVHLRSLRLEDLNPFTWVDRADRQGHLIYSRAEKFYYDLRVVYEIESRFRQMGDNPPADQQEAPKQETPGGGSSQDGPSDSDLASNAGGWPVLAAHRQLDFAAGNRQAGASVAGRSLLR
jgi:hypothetical protein